MSEERQEPDLFAALVERQTLLFAQLRKVETKLAKLRDKHSRCSRELVEVQNQIHALRIQPAGVDLPSSGFPTARNLSLLKVWAALHRTLATDNSRHGVPNHKCQNAIRIANPGIPDSTVRSHLYRFKRKGWIVKKGAYWQLAVPLDGRGNQ